MQITKRKDGIIEANIFSNENILSITILNISGNIKLYQTIMIELL
jgi:hypothetical protein